MKQRAVVLLSGGLDSAITLFLAKKNGYDCYPLIFDYGQRHRKETGRAIRIARYCKTNYKLLRLSFPWKGSSLLDKGMELPFDRNIKDIKRGIPSTYVPGRNTIFISLAASYAEAIEAEAIFIGAHFEDSSGYPDCRKVYLKAFDKVVRLGTKAGLEKRLALKFPLIDKSKGGIIKLGKRLAVPFGLTWSCYKGGQRPCMRCDSCKLRAKGFKEAKLKDPLI